MVIDVFGKFRSSRYYDRHLSGANGIDDRAGTAMQNYQFGLRYVALKCRHVKKRMALTRATVEWRVSVLHDHRLRQGMGYRTNGIQHSWERLQRIADTDKGTHSKAPEYRPLGK